MSEPEVRARIAALAKANERTRRPRWVLLAGAAADLNREAQNVERKLRKQWDWIEKHPDDPRAEGEWTDAWLATHADWVTLQRALRDAATVLDERAA